MDISTLKAAVDARVLAALEISKELDDNSQRDSDSAREEYTVHRLAMVTRVVEAAGENDSVIADALKVALERYFSQPPDNRPKPNIAFFCTLDPSLNDEQVLEVQQRFRSLVG
uniref:Uncharacterized protein n=1 Tax=Moniliophthora roreri TaxID=221103 RepID=A0A0W0FV63_MONRR